MKFDHKCIYVLDKSSLYRSMCNLCVCCNPVFIVVCEEYCLPSLQAFVFFATHFMELSALEVLYPSVGKYVS